MKVTAGEKVTTGQQLGEVGHSGNSTAPHLHFHLMDSSDIVTAKGLPCCFQEYELFTNGVWEKVYNGIPNNRDRIKVNYYTLCKYFFFMGQYRNLLMQSATGHG